MITKDIVKTQRSRAGELLVLTKNQAATDALLKATSLGQLAKIKVTEHPILNSSKGIIFCHDLKSLTEEEIKEGLKDQGVIEVYKIKKWVENKLTDTAAIILTFNSPVLPEYVRAGFLQLSIRLYIPNPLKCTACHKFGHTKKRCTSDPKCYKCSEATPHNQPCTTLKCINCGEAHTSNSKECRVYKREVEIVKIKTVDRLTFPEAKVKYFRLYANTTPANQTTYADTLKTAFNPPNTPQKEQNKEN